MEGKFLLEILFSSLLKYFFKGHFSKDLLRDSKTFSHSFKNTGSVWNEPHDKPDYYLILSIQYVQWTNEMERPVAYAVSRIFLCLMIYGLFPKMAIKPYIGELVLNSKFNLILILKLILKMSYS